MMEKWTLPPYYIGKHYPDYYVLIYRNRDSGLLDTHNFVTTLKMLGGEHPPNVIIMRFSHFLVGWLELLMIHESAEDKIEQGHKIKEMINNYPILDEDTFEQVLDERINELIVEIKEDIANDRWDYWFDTPSPTDDEIYEYARRAVLE